MTIKDIFMKKIEKFGATILTIALTLSLLAGCTAGSPTSSATANSSSGIIKDNVTVLDSEQADSVTVSEEGLFRLRGIEESVAESIQEGGVIVFPISKNNPNGGLFIVNDLREENGDPVFIPTPATLGDVFDEATFSQEFELTTDGQLIAASEDDNRQSLIGRAVGSTFTKVYAAESIPEDLSKEYGYVFDIGKELGVSDNVATVQAGIDVSVKVDFKVEDMGRHVLSSVIVNAEAGILARLQNQWKAEKEFTILERNLPNVQFFVGPVPVVIANSLTIDGSLSADLEYKPEVGLYYGAGKKFGYIYDNNVSDKPQKINESTASFEKSFNPDSTSATANFDVGVTVSIQSLLYGSSGPSGSADVKTYLKGTFKDGEIKAGTKTDAGLSAELIVNIPVIDNELVNTTLWESERTKLFPTDREWYNLIDPEDMELSFDADMAAIQSEIAGEYREIIYDHAETSIFKIYNNGTCEDDWYYISDNRNDRDSLAIDAFSGNYSITEKPNGAGYSIIFTGGIPSPDGGYVPNTYDLCLNVSSIEEAENLIIANSPDGAFKDNRFSADERKYFFNGYDGSTPVTFPTTFLISVSQSHEYPPYVYVKGAFQVSGPPVRLVTVEEP
jgi:hypothetical protein